MAMMSEVSDCTGQRLVHVPDIEKWQHKGVLNKRVCWAVNKGMTLGSTAVPHAYRTDPLSIHLTEPVYATIQAVV